jgi:hypothetical protein
MTDPIPFFHPGSPRAHAALDRVMVMRMHILFDMIAQIVPDAREPTFEEFCRALHLTYKSDPLADFEPELTGQEAQLKADLPSSPADIKAFVEKRNRQMYQAYMDGTLLKLVEYVEGQL